MESGLQDYEILAVYQVDQPVFFANAAGPGTGEQVAQWFWFADPAARVAQRVLDEPVNPHEGGAVG
jgi:hypothetical protein